MTAQTAEELANQIEQQKLEEQKAEAYLFNDYCEDIGTIKSCFEANLAIAEQITDSIISHGCFLDNCRIEHSVVGVRSWIGSNVHLNVRSLPLLAEVFHYTNIEKQVDTVMLVADCYETDAGRGELLAEGNVPIGIGENTTIQKCIIDKNARIGKNVIISNSEGVVEADRTSEGFYI